jgi:MFS family permease
MDPTIANPAPAAPPATSGTRVGPLINRDYALLWSGQLVSNLGDFVFDTTLIVWIATQLAVGQPWAPLAVSGVLIAATAPILLVGPLAGVFVDRWDKRRTLLTMDVARAVLILLLVLATDVVPLPFVPGGHLSLGVKFGAIYAIVFLAAICAQFFNPARSALIAHLVDDAHQPQASSLGQMSMALATIFGPPLAAPLLFAFGVQWALLINALSFVLSFLAVSAIHAPHTAHRENRAERSSMAREFGEGLRFFFGNRILVVLLVAVIIASLGGGALNALDVFFFTSNLHAPAQLYGFAGATYAGGVLVGAVLGGAFALRIGLLRLLWLSVVSIGLCIFAFSRMTSLGPALAILFLAGLPQATINVAAGPIFIRVTPKRLLGRVVAILQPTITAASLISIAFAGYLASTVLRGFSVTIGNITFGTLDTIFGAAALLILLGGIYAALSLRGLALPSSASDDAPDAPAVALASAPPTSKDVPGAKRAD